MPASTIHIYPKIAPNKSSRADGLAPLMSSGGEYPTDTIDYIKFTEIEVNYSGGGGISSTKTTINSKDLDSCYLYIPQNISTAYGVQYNPVAFGALGIEAAKNLQSTSNEQIVASLQDAASAATPEALFGSIASGISGVNNLLGVGGTVSNNALSAVGTGMIFNPYQEQVFEGLGFREHNFSFKLVARNSNEATEIKNIIKFFKRGMLPSLDGGPSKGISATGGGAAGGGAGGPTSSARYLKVPNRFKVEFKRLNVRRNGVVSSTSLSDIPGLYRFKDCVLTNVNVAYTPDGQYVSTEDGMIPALNMDLRFAETAMVTKEDIDQEF
jgi:hypothetical protein